MSTKAQEKAFEILLNRGITSQLDYDMCLKIASAFSPSLNALDAADKRISQLEKDILILKTRIVSAVDCLKGEASVEYYGDPLAGTDSLWLVGEDE